ncbi:MAG: glycine cleavage system aminomethyltransferase GcvT [Spirochaetota bacterium]|nr:glycine cleavage system aminomethyltransferase GcvT [Spirochaetota bacterium]
MEKTTPLYQKHKSLGAKLIDFAGYTMPVWYKGIIEEHKAVRERVGLFDITHMGEILITGLDREKLVNFLITNDLNRIDNKQILYTFMCDENGLILDDLLVYLQADKILLIVNANKSDNLVKHINENASSYNVEIDNLSNKTGALSLQGPKSFELCNKIFNENIDKINYYSYINTEFNGNEIIISRTGYTGEKGVELFFNIDLCEILWDKLLSEGKEFGIEPCGLGSRDILRLEMGFPLHGQELQGYTPVDIQKNWCVAYDKQDFIGKSALQNLKKAGILTTLSAFVLLEKGIPRHGYDIIKDNKKIGIVTSGGFSPQLDKGIGLCIIPISENKVGNTINIKIRENNILAQITKLPFVPNNVK